MRIFGDRVSVGECMSDGMPVQRTVEHVSPVCRGILRQNECVVVVRLRVKKKA